MFFGAASIVLLLCLGFDGVYGADVSYTSHDRSTEIYGGCHEFYGKVSCESGDAILPTAKVGLWEADDSFFSSDKWITAAPIGPDGKYLINACVWDYALVLKLTLAQVYLEFREACPNVVYSYAHYTKPGKPFAYQIFQNGHLAGIIE